MILPSDVPQEKQTKKRSIRKGEEEQTMEQGKKEKERNKEGSGSKGIAELDNEDERERRTEGKDR
jgi:hypothetical protein